MSKLTFDWDKLENYSCPICGTVLTELGDFYYCNEKTDHDKPYKISKQRLNDIVKNLERQRDVNFHWLNMGHDPN